MHMSQQTDKLFRDKLENFQMTAPQQAWSKVESRLDKKSHVGFWLKIAAGLVLLAVAAFLLWPKTIDPTMPVAEQINGTDEILNKKNIEKK